MIIKSACICVRFCKKENLRKAISELKKEFNFNKIIKGKFIDRITKSIKVLYYFPNNNLEYKLVINSYKLK